VLLPAPGVAGTLASGEAFLTDPHVRRALAQGAEANLAFMGIGAPRQDSILIRQGTIVAWDEVSELQQQGAVGDINLRYFDANGQLVASDLNDRVIGLTLEDIRRIPQVVGVAGGAAKLKAIRGALEGGLVTVLVTDHLTGEQLIEQVSE
jgi:DNA-binding transcriptional regulator LsrR (DeoR family)